MASLECCSRTVVAHFSETPSVSSNCYIWSHHGHCQAVSPDYRTQFQNSYSLTSCPCQVRGLFHNQGSTKPLFLLWGKKVNTAIVVAEERHCKVQRRLNGYDFTTGSLTPQPCSIVFQDFVIQTLLCLFVFPLEKAVQAQRVMQLGYLSVCFAFVFYQLGECWSKCLVKFHQFYHCYFFLRLT